MKELLDVDIDPAEYLPPEIEVNGFTNVAAALSVSPAFVEQYVDAASAVAHLAVGEPKPKVATAFFPKPAADQDAYVAGMPLGTRGGMKAMHTFPADGEYRLTVTNLGAGLYPRSLETRHTLVVLIDRHEEWRGDIGGEEDLRSIDRGGAPAREAIMKRFSNIPLQVKAGTHEIAVTFIERSRAASDELVSTFTPQKTFSSTGAPRVPGLDGGINLIGPFNSPGLSPTASRKKLFVCQPEVADRERACAVADHLASRAPRVPPSRIEGGRRQAHAVLRRGAQGAGRLRRGRRAHGHGGAREPRLPVPSGRAARRRRRAARTRSPTPSSRRGSPSSYGVRGRTTTLLGLAAAGKLSRPDVLDEQVRRMLRDPRAAVLVDEFALPWLHVQDLDAIQPDKILFPEFTDALRGDFAEEIRLFLASVLLDDRDVRTLLTANYTFVNERLARHYGIPAIVGPQFRRVTLADPRRFGLLGKGAVLLRTSYGDRTSPVLRGQWVLDKLMGTPPTPPPPGVDTNLTTPPGEKPKTVRARLEQHRTSSVCKSCHGVIDPYGLALENFTATGRWRDDDRRRRRADRREHGARGRQEVIGAGRAQRRAARAARPVRAGVHAEAHDVCARTRARVLRHAAVRAIVRSAAAQDYRFSALVTGIVRSDAFRMQAAVKESGAGVQAAVNPKDSATARE